MTTAIEVAPQSAIEQSAMSVASLVAQVRLVQEAMAAVKGQADGGRVASILRSLLSQSS